MAFAVAKGNLVTRHIGSLLLLRQGKGDPTDAEWAETMALLGTLLTAGPREVRTLVQTDGGGVTPVQRGVLQKALENAQIRVAVVTDDAKARMTSSAVALANRNHRSFSTSEWARAFLHLGLTPDEGRAAQTALKAMAILVA